MKWTASVTLVALFLGCLLSGCVQGNVPYEIVVYVGDGVAWSGTYLVETVDGEVTEYSIEHVGPHRFTVKAKSILLRFKNGAAQGRFAIEIYKNGALVANSMTFSPGSVLTVAGN